MFESINETVFGKKIIEESTKALFETAWSLAKDIGKKTVDEVKIRLALRNYTENYVKRHGSIKVLGMSEPMSLFDIYTKVQVISPSYLNKEREISDLEIKFRSKRGEYGFSERKNGIAIANEERKVNILGAPGSGKSTFLKRVGIEALLLKGKVETTGKFSNCYEHDCIPVLIELKRFKYEKIDLKELIQNEFEIAGFPETESFTDKSLIKGKLLILLDGIDEVPNAVLEETIEHLRDFTNKYSKNRFITSCRTAFYKSYLKDFIDVEIASFDNDQILSFINNWFSLDRKSKAHDILIKLLYEKSNEATLELARTPLLLTFLCLTFDESLKFPANRSSLYRRALMILMEKWAAEKRIHNEDIYQNLNSDLELEMLAEIAANFYKDDKIFFYQHEIKKGISSFLESSLNIKNIPLSKILEAIEIQQGLLVQRAPDIYSFSHLTIQEYLTAYFYYSPRKTPELVEKYLFASRWREVFLLLAGISNADDLLISMNEKLMDFSKSNALVSSTINWVNTLIPNTEDFEKDVFKRILVSSLIIRFKRYDDKGFIRQLRLDSYVDNLLAAINSPQNKSYLIAEHINRKNSVQLLEIIASWQNPIPDYSSYKNAILTVQQDRPMSKMLNGSRHQLRRKLLEPFYSALNVPEGLANLRKDEYKSLLDYFEAYTLLIDCKNASLRVSKDTWKLICGSILKN